MLGGTLRRPHDLVPPLGRRAWWLLAGYALEKLGSGLIWPFLVVYMHEVREIDLATAGLVLSAASVAGVIAVPVSGELVDRIGAGWTVAITVVLGAAGTVGFASMNGPVWAFVAGCLYGGGTSGMWNALPRCLPKRYRRYSAVGPSEWSLRSRISVWGWGRRPEV